MAELGSPGAIQEALARHLADCGVEEFDRHGYEAIGQAVCAVRRKRERFLKQRKVDALRKVLKWTDIPGSGKWPQSSKKLVVADEWAASQGFGWNRKTMAWLRPCWKAWHPFSIKDSDRVKYPEQWRWEVDFMQSMPGLGLCFLGKVDEENVQDLMEYVNEHAERCGFTVVSGDESGG